MAAKGETESNAAFLAGAPVDCAGWLAGVCGGRSGPECAVLEQVCELLAASRKTAGRGGPVPARTARRALAVASILHRLELDADTLAFLPINTFPLTTRIPGMLSLISALALNPAYLRL